MIKLKKLILSTEGYSFRDGLMAVKDDTGTVFAFSDEYWGNTFVDGDALLTNQHMEKNILFSIESIKAEKLSDGFVTLTMGLDKQKTSANQILLFMPPYPPVKERPKTTGKFLFTRYPSEAIVLLNEDDTITFTNNFEKFSLKVIGGELKLIKFTKV